MVAALVVVDVGQVEALQEVVVDLVAVVEASVEVTGDEDEEDREEDSAEVVEAALVVGEGLEVDEAVDEAGSEVVVGVLEVAEAEVHDLSRKIAPKCLNADYTIGHLGNFVDTNGSRYLPAIAIICLYATCQCNCENYENILRCILSLSSKAHEGYSKYAVESRCVKASFLPMSLLQRSPDSAQFLSQLHEIGTPTIHVRHEFVNLEGE